MNIVIIGAGLMGQGIGLTFARAGHQVTLVDRTDPLLESALAAICESAATLVQHGSLAADAVAPLLKRIALDTDLAHAVGKADFVAEVVPEVATIKREVICAIDAASPAGAVIMSNTSGLDIFALACDAMRHPERLVTAHWYAPAHIIPLVEVAPGPQTTADVVARTADLLRQAGKFALAMRRFAPGYVVNKIQHSFASAMFDLLQSDLIEPEDIDRAVKAVLGIRMPVVGIVQSMDFNGLDTVQAICATLGIDVPILREKVEAGDLGASTGRGMYDYGERTPDRVIRERDIKFLQMIDFLKSIEAFEPV
ncbi:3-hydroxyacyl-CoA dehydrogenase NAD-binding domain-containing protein [Sphingobium sp. MK2]|uniref:3-hydroxyacyl-CoA dehydrogenase family protein n=1 Tax=Sphingobium sp. MK2 TaxID=3116540 RepID=UPI0032E366E0